MMVTINLANILKFYGIGSIFSLAIAVCYILLFRQKERKVIMNEKGILILIAISWGIVPLIIIQAKEDLCDFLYDKGDIKSRTIFYMLNSYSKREAFEKAVYQNIEKKIHSRHNWCKLRKALKNKGYDETSSHSEVAWVYDRAERLSKRLMKQTADNSVKL